jgi:hypothetical protein
MSDEPGATVKDLYALMVAQYGDVDNWERALRGDRWVMNLASYKRIRATLRAAGVAYPADAGDDDPRPEDVLFGLPVEVREDGGTPHVVEGPRR